MEHLLTFPPSRTLVLEASATVQDLQILDKNDQALQTMDQLLQDDSAGDDSATAPPTGYLTAQPQKKHKMRWKKGGGTR